MKHATRQILFALLLAALATLMPRLAAAADDVAAQGEADAAESLLNDFSDRLLWEESLPGGIGWPIAASGTTTQIVGRDLSYTHSVAKLDQNDVSLAAGVHNPLRDDDFEVPDFARDAMPDPWTVNLGLHYTRPLGDGWTASSALNVASASDHNAASLREMNLNLNASLRMPNDEHSAWVVTFNYAPAVLPAGALPSVAFSYDPSPRFHANIGLPAECRYKASDKWEFQASYMLVHTIHAKAIYKLGPRLDTFAACDWASEPIVLLDSSDPNARINIDEPRVSLGLQTLLPWHWTASTAVGYIFDRDLLTAEPLPAGSLTPLGLSNGAFASMNVDLRF